MIRRRISNAARPSLRKGYSLNAFDARPHSTQSTNPPPFVFGPGSKPSKPLLEAFIESPPSEKKPAPVDNASKQNAPPLPKLVFAQNGSPMGGLRRMSSARPLGAQRQGLGRRTQSLQCNNEPFRPMRSEKRTCTDGLLRSPTMEIDETHEPKLPHHTSNDDVDPLPRITTETLVDLMNGAHTDKVESPTIIDCRFEYEFQGGHVEGAINYNDKELLATKLFEEVPSNSTRRPLIFHCEYSAHRAPLM